MKPFLPLVFAAALQAQVSYEALRQSPNENWLTYAGDYQGRGLSPLVQITPDNARNLTPKWTFQVPGAKGLRARPIVSDGVMYYTNTNAIYALDARSGRVIWQYNDTQSKKEAVNRGAAILGNRVYFATADCHLVSLDRRTGGLAWRKQYGDIKDGVFCSAAPVALRDKIIVGTAGGDEGMRGYLAALDAVSGKEVWRTYTVPKRGEPGSETWGDYIEYGGAATWLSGTFDPETNTLYWTTGNPWPDFYGGDRKGDNLYSCSLLALDADTGKRKWYFQFTPGDWHDWDAQSWPVLAEVNWDGKPRKVVFHANRNGFLYVLDRETGRYLRSQPLIEKLDWAKGIDANGRPIPNPGKNPTPEGNRVCPGVRGATNWMSQSWNAATGLLSVVVLEQCDIYTSSSKKPEPGTNFAGGGAGPRPNEPGQFFVRSFDPLTGDLRWQYPMTGKAEMWAGLTGTASGLLFSGDDDGHLIVLDSRTGKHLYHYQTGAQIYSSPITYMVEGKQYVTIANANALFTFSLFAPVESVPVPPVKIH
ncbi:MAG: pyrroloquinoline quinone-dependent dehydrogenase [Acidobacteriota bacterium]